ncbi:MAG: undecaprenyl-diphosphate phosphatase [Kiritimatiellaeota bacterium]|nr:undecaprenyl-diphosphate phosphatase [Kiritimatiellota bacterium]
MSDYLSISLLALLQGIAEFLPISSSGHLVLAEHFLGIHAPGATLEVFLHTGTLLALFVFYRKRMATLIANALRGDKPTWRYLLMIALAIVPATVVYLAFGKKIEAAFETPRMVAALLCVTGLILLLPKLLKSATPPSEAAPPVTPFQSVMTGLAQAVALLPGISRSGSTITAARLTGVRPAAAAEFSFFIYIPLQLGGTLLEVVKLHKGAEGAAHPSAFALLLGIAIAAVVGYVSLAVLIRMLHKNTFWRFGVYCLVMGAVAIIFT